MKEEGKIQDIVEDFYMTFMATSQTTGEPYITYDNAREMLDHLKEAISSRDTYWKEKMKRAVEKKQKQVSGEKRLNAGQPNTQVFLDGYNHALNDIITLIERI